MGYVTVVVRDHDEAIRFYVHALGIGLVTVAVFRDLYGNLWDLRGMARSR